MKPITLIVAAGTAALLMGRAHAAPDDDLAVVKKAVAAAQAPAVPELAAEAAPAPRIGGKTEPKWLRIRAFEKNAKGDTRKRVSVNLPLSLVRALDDFPIDLCRNQWRDQAKENRPRCELKLAEVLAALEAGQELVEVEGDDQTVKIWVE